MPTPMYVYAEIAARYGVDSDDFNAVDDFFSEKIQCLPKKVQQAILDELLSRDGEVKGELE